EMENADAYKQREPLPNFSRCNQQNISDEDVFDFLVAFSRSTEQQHGRSRCNNVCNSDDCFLRNLTRALPCDRKNRGTNQSKTKSDGKRRPVFQLESEQNCDTNSKRSHLRHGDVDEDDAALNDVQPKIDQQPRQKNAGRNWPKHYLPHNYFSAAARRETSVSINLM